MTSIRMPVVVLTASIAAGIAVVITATYYPLLSWWVISMTATAMSVLRYRLDVVHRRRSELNGGECVTPSQVSNNERVSFRAWFASHNLLAALIALSLMLLVWHAVGHSTVTLTLMAAFMACAVLGLLGVLVGPRRRTLGLCWEMPCPPATLTPPSAAVAAAGAVITLAGRSAYACERDWSLSRGRRHSELLALQESTPADQERAIIRFHDAAGERAMNQRERIARAGVMVPVFLVTVLLSWLPVLLLAGDASLPPLFDIPFVSWSRLTQGAHGSPAADDTLTQGRDDQNATEAPADGGASADARREGATPSAAKKDADSSASRQQARGDQQRGSPAESGGESARNDSSGAAASASKSAGRAGSHPADAGESASGAGAGAARGDDARAGDAGSAGGNGGGGYQAASQRGDATGGGSGSGGYGSSGPPPQRAASPSPLPALPQNPGAVVDLELPPMTRSSSGQGGDAAQSSPTDLSRARRDAPYRPTASSAPRSGEAGTPEPRQRWPNWIFQLLNK